MVHVKNVHLSKEGAGTGEMGQQLEALVVLQEDLSSVLSTHRTVHSFLKFHRI